MSNFIKKSHSSAGWAALVFLLASLAGQGTSAADLEEMKARGALRHLGVPYANFVTGAGDGLDVELITMFARHLGLTYEYVKTSWDQAIPDLTGKIVKPKGDGVEIVGPAQIKGDVLASGFTVLPWRGKVLDYSTPTFPNEVWFVTRADSPIRPIRPSGSLDEDIKATKKLLSGLTVLGVANTCLDPVLYGLAEAGAGTKLFPGALNELAPAIINGLAEGTLLDLPDALIALEKWAGQIKVIGPLSPRQHMACGFAQESPRLREAFNNFFMGLKRSGVYQKLITKYYPGLREYYPDFFKVD